MRALMQAATGNDPSLADIVRMVHPKPADEGRKAFYAWLIGKPYDVAALPAEIAAFEAWKRDPEGDLPRGAVRMADRLSAVGRAVGGARHPDGLAGAAHEPQHAGAQRRVRRGGGRRDGGRPAGRSRRAARRSGSCPTS